MRRAVVAVVAMLVTVLGLTLMPAPARAYHEGPLLERTLYCFGASWALSEAIGMVRETIELSADGGNISAGEHIGIHAAAVTVAEKNAVAIRSNLEKCLDAVLPLAEKNPAVNQVACSTLEELDTVTKAIDKMRTMLNEKRATLRAHLSSKPSSFIDTTERTHNSFVSEMAAKVTQIRAKVLQLRDRT
ncbi:MAG: hypothetical protein FJX65_10595 [Alphaproteobacteria bacterium]|nr:hypothetical protein [Alphaproteobacteria bacterium]